jgi:hypothetical protein
MPRHPFLITFLSQNEHMWRARSFGVRPPAMTDNEIVEKVLDVVRTKLSQHHHVALDTPPSDQAGLGELHPDVRK